MAQVFRLPVVIEQDEDGVFIVECPVIQGCHSYGYTLEEALKNICGSHPSTVNHLFQQIGARWKSLSKLRPIRPDELVRLLERLGFVRTHQKGSHATYRHLEPVHHGRDIPLGTLRKILRDISLTPEEFERLRQQ